MLPQALVSLRIHGERRFRSQSGSQLHCPPRLKSVWYAARSGECGFRPRTSVRSCQDSHTLLAVAVIKGAPKAPAVVQAAVATQVAPSATLSSCEHKGARPNTDTQEVAARAPVHDDMHQEAVNILLHFADGPPTLESP